MRPLTPRARVLANLDGRVVRRGRSSVPMVVRQAGLVGVTIGANVLLGLSAMAIGVVSAAVLAGPVGRRIRARRAAAAYGAHLVTYLRRVAAALRSGYSLREALLGAPAPPGDLADDLSMLRDASSRGEPLSEVLTDWAASRDRGDVRLLVAGICLGLMTGGVTAIVVDGLADTVELGVSARADAVAQAAQARLSAVVLVLIPLALGIGQIVTGGPAGEWLVGTAGGRLCLVAGATTQMLGGWWMHRLVERPT